MFSLMSWTVAYQAPLSVGFSKQEYWSGLPFPSPGDLPDPGIKPGSPALQADALPSKPPGNVPVYILLYFKHRSRMVRNFSSKSLLVILFYFLCAQDKLVKEYCGHSYYHHRGKM